MARIRNITDLRMQVPAIGRSVAPEEIVDVPDDLFLSLAWPRSLWHVTANPKAKPGEDALTVLPDAWPDELVAEPVEEAPMQAPEDVPDQPALEGVRSRKK